MSSLAAVRIYLIDTAVGVASGLYLHPPQAAVSAQDEVEAFAVSVGLATPKPRLAALLMNASSASSPWRLRVGPRGLPRGRMPILGRACFFMG